MNGDINIRGEHRQVLAELLAQFLPGVTVWAYGSRVTSRAQSSSDLDLVVFSTPEQRRLVSELKDELAESNLPFIVDLHVWDEVPEHFREAIERDHRVLQEKAN